MAKENANSASVSIYYEGVRGDYIAFYQRVLWLPEPEGEYPAGVISVFGIDSEDAEVEMATIAGYEVRLFHYTLDTGEKELSAVWTNHEYFFFLHLQFEDVDVASKIIESVRPVD